MRMIRIWENVVQAPLQRHFNNCPQILHTDIVYNLSITLHAYALI
jgi:hypothetical protein